MKTIAIIIISLFVASCATPFVITTPWGDTSNDGKQVIIAPRPIVIPVK